jgi:hypothetical protein
MNFVRMLLFQLLSDIARMLLGQGLMEVLLLLASVKCDEF